ncbi:hypothetical protein SAMN05661091_1646 [Paenibacillus uliginis N3/975]|uniref:Uncharacterized protein n=1 Tax=Paenibacillus uliginis N3/975 TaxID=1313296 RepID=A0A1X7H4C3_9BACL|nr:hypothetical protein [Paenibacillus uliginis]SMF78976.1 hypothetical protein SAMN05661091_1646 [Paenibacillus uliginis N3/975]
MWRRDHFPRETFNAVADFQHQLAEKLAIIFDREHIQIEWSASIDQTIYSPRLDLAVGPFAYEESFVYSYNRLIRSELVSEFCRRLFRAHLNNLGITSFDFNYDLEQKLFMNLNSRCFISIEIENAVTQKHLIGGIINASALGRIAIMIPWNERQLRAFIRTLNYLEFLKNAEKNTLDTTNIFIITKEQIEEILNAISEERMGIG